MMKKKGNETIAAVSTPSGEGAIGIIRISGDLAKDIADKIFIPMVPRKLDEFITHRLYRGSVHNNGGIIDDALLTIMEKPNSYTGEDMVEIHAHGGPVILTTILNLVLKSGARLADPGEFSRRAFLNEKIDLNQAESIAWMISAASEAELKSAASQMKGELSERMIKIKEGLIKLLAMMELRIDFEEYEEDEPRYKDIYKGLNRIKVQLKNIYERASKGEFMAQGLSVVIVGKPNVGKSSLLNTFLQEKRAIVSSLPGTTRDTIEEVIKLNDIPLRIIDTAGIRKPRQDVEREGLKRAEKKIKEADLILLVIDSGTDITEEDMQTLHLIRDKQALLVVNKSDLTRKVDLGRIKNELKRRKVVRISARRNWGLPRLKSEISEIIKRKFIKSEAASVMISQRRKKILQESMEAIESALSNIKKNISLEFIILDVKDVLKKIQLIMGEGVGDEILDEIFANFCLGK